MLCGIDIQWKEATGQAYFPVVIRAASGHWPPQEHCGKSRYRLRHCHILLLLADANSVATREGVPVVPMEDVPVLLCHRTTRDSVGGILQDGLAPGALGSGRVHCYFAQTAVGSDDYRSGVRASAPVEVKWDIDGSRLFAHHHYGRRSAVSGTVPAQRHRLHHQHPQARGALHSYHGKSSWCRS